MIILAIETSCDETAVCLLETEFETKSPQYPRYRILENIIHSQIDLHAKYGGVFPMMAKREHEKNLPIIIDKILEKIDAEKIKINQIAVTKGPGLEPALWAGIDYAKKLGEKLNVPVVGINHMLGHILGSLLSTSETSGQFSPLKSPALPALALLISGGHTELVLIKDNFNNYTSYQVVGHTKDDAAGEAYDKVARLLNLPYPGGPQVSELAEKYRQNSVKQTRTTPPIHFPRPMIHSADLDFSFSGLKTAVLYEIRKTNENASMKPIKTAPDGATQINHLSETLKMEIACEFENAVTEVLVKKTAKAIEKYGIQSLIIGGGVSANKHIQAALEKLAKENSISLFLPPSGVSGDNALMIGIAGALMTKIDPSTENQIAAIKANGNLSF